MSTTSLGVCVEEFGVLLMLLRLLPLSLSSFTSCRVRGGERDFLIDILAILRLLVVELVVPTVEGDLGFGDEFVFLLRLLLARPRNSIGA